MQTLSSRTSLPQGILLGGFLLLAAAGLQTTQAQQIAVPGMTGVTGRLLLTGQQMEILSHMSLVYLDDGQGGTAKTIEITGVNVRIVNGLAATNGYPMDPNSVDPGLTATNGLGNLIIGYNELGNPHGDDRRGSHNLVVGNRNNFLSFGGTVSASENTSVAPYSSVVGGSGNVAYGGYSSVIGGWYNVASGNSSTITGGGNNSASGFGSSISGGEGNSAAGPHSSVGGGWSNAADGNHSVVSGGNGRTAANDDDWVAGSLFQED